MLEFINLFLYSFIILSRTFTGFGSRNFLIFHFLVFSIGSYMTQKPFIKNLNNFDSKRVRLSCAYS